MFAISNYDYECTKKCKLINHGNAITAALTKRAITDEYLAAFIAKTCKNFAEILDDKGRSALHMASSVGRYAITEWLINCGANIALKDRESGHTSMHRALYYGYVGAAVLLQKYGGIIDMPDEDFVNPLQLCSHISKQKDNGIGHEIMVWGTNKNYNLGVGNGHERETPDYLDYFRKNRISIKKMSMSSLHSVFLTCSGDVYCAGHGKGGRLGNGAENTVALPVKVVVPMKSPDEKVIDVSTGKYHTLILTSHNIIYSCGENTHNQLGIQPPPEKQLTLREISGLHHLSDKNISRVIAKDHHSIAVGDREVFVWGWNGGQFGFKKEVNPIIMPKQLPLNAETKETTVKLIDSSNATIVCYTCSNFLYIFNNFKMKSYKNPLMETFECMSVSGGEFRPKREDVTTKTKPLRLLVFTIAKNIYIWYEDIQQFVKCIFPPYRNLEIEKIMWCNSNVLVLLLGNLFLGTITNKLNAQTITSTSDYQDTYVKREICATNKTKIVLKRLKNINNAVDVVCDSEGENFGVLVENCRRYFNVPNLTAETYNFATLLDHANECDNIHDVVFFVDHQPFPVHKFIIYCRSKHLRKVIEKSTEKSIHLKYEGLNIKIFEIVLRYIYANRMICQKDIVDLMKFGRMAVNNDNTNQMIANLRKVLKLLELGELAESTKILNEQETIGKFPILKRDRYPEMRDVTIKLSDNQEILAHKCVLVARLEYFNMMFNHSWAESKVANLKTIPIEYMDPIIDYLYSNDMEKLKQEKHPESYLYNMIIICDQFFIEDLKKLFEVIISDKINLKNVGELLEFAFQYNCEIIKDLCMQFISVNLAKILENRSLDCLDGAILDHLNKFYRDFYRLNDYRTITPYADAVDDETMALFVEDFAVDLNAKQSELNASKSKTPKSKSHKSDRFVIDRRNYEREAMDLIKNLSVDESMTKASPQKKDEATNGNASKLESEIIAWQKVVDKADMKKKTVLAGLKSNDVLKHEAKTTDNFSKLKSFLEKETTPPKDITPPATEFDESVTRTICLGDFTPQKVKLSQKQRKRLTSTSEKVAPKEIIPITPEPVQGENPNPWQRVNNSAADMFKSEPINIPTKARKHLNSSGSLEQTTASSPKASTSFSLQLKPSSSSKQRNSDNRDFNKILEDERKQKQYYDKIRTKSLIQTQIEERAIEELKAFYNVENVFDENIRVERFKLDSTNLMNFAVWQHQ